MLQGDTAAHSKWTARMAETAAILKQRLWRESHGACFDRERDGNGSYVTMLVHNNLRAMCSTTRTEMTGVGHRRD